MIKEELIKKIQKARADSPQRKFSQIFDLIVNLKDIDLKKTEQIINVFVTLPHSRGKKMKICALVGPEMMEQAKSVCDGQVSLDDFGKFQQKKDIRKLAQSYDFFIAQATIMPKIATAFGKVFGPKGKMPNPKAGCVVPPNANLKPLYDKLQKTIRLQTKNDPIIMVPVGSEKMGDAEIADNILAAYEGLVHQLSKGAEQVRNAFVKLTMGKSAQLMGKVEEAPKEK
ncbi:50S ribosomal protein L1 [Candidatus Woesearchaeota archaeon]|nr:50S ribosomal protein L1 [Candidatus Woesearchaeota archaeon]